MDESKYLGDGDGGGNRGTDAATAGLFVVLTAAVAYGLKKLDTHLSKPTTVGERIVEFAVNPFVWAVAACVSFVTGAGLLIYTDPVMMGVLLVIGAFVALFGVWLLGDKRGAPKKRTDQLDRFEEQLRQDEEELQERRERLERKRKRRSKLQSVT